MFLVCYNGLEVYMENNIQELAPFCKACDEFISGKYILVDLKISALLKTIEQDEKIKNIVSDCLNDFDFASGFNLSAIKNGLILPNNDKGIIALVYGLLYRFSTHEIDFYEFLSKYYNKNGEISNEEFSNFAKTIITPFETAVCNIYKSRHVLVNSNDFQNNYYNKIKQTIKLIVSHLDVYKLKMNENEEFKMLLNSLFVASDKNDKNMVYSLMIALDYFTKVNKKARLAYLTLEECFA